MKRIIGFFRKDRFLKGTLIVGLVGFIFYLIFVVLYKVYCEGRMTNSEIVFLIGSIKDIFQVLFFAIVGSVTILSYMQARKTLFTPIKTETFKLQIKSFEDILAFFQNKKETDFTHQFDFDFMVVANSRIMIKDYISTFFENEIKINKNAMDELFTKFDGAIVTINYMEKNFQSPEYYEKIKPVEKIEITNPALILEKWKDYEYGQVYFSKKFSEEIDKLTKLIASPLLPINLKLELADFEDKVRGNLEKIGIVLTQIAQELPKKLPNAKTVEDFSSTGVWNKYNHECEKLQPTAEKILSDIRQYLKIDTLID